MLGRCLFATAGVAFWTAFWMGCSGSNDSPIAPIGDASTKDVVVADTSPPPPVKDAGKADAKDPDEEEPLPEAVDVTYGVCPELTPCGGEVVGTWLVTGGCVSDTTFANAKQGACAAVTESDVVITAAGTMVATETSVHRNTKFELKAKLSIPQGCRSQAGGPSATCQIVAYGMTVPFPPATEALFDSASCTDDGFSGCNCNISKVLRDNSTSDYTVIGNTIQSDDPDRSFLYCVDGTKNSYTETTSGDFPIFVELTKQ